MTQSDAALDEQISVLKGSLLLSKILYKQKQALPHLRLDRDLADQIADIRLYQFEVNQQRELISSPSSYVNNLLATQPSEQVTPQLRKTLLDLAITRADLLERLSRELSSLLNESITLQLNQKQLLSTSQSLRATLDEQMFWIPSNKPLDGEWLQAVPLRLAKQVTTLPWSSSLSELADGLAQRPLLFLPLLLLIAALLWRRKNLYLRLNKVHKDIGHFKRDSHGTRRRRSWSISCWRCRSPLAWHCAAWPCRSTPADRTPTSARRCCRWPRPGWCSTPPTGSSPRAAWRNCISAGKSPRSNSSRAGSVARAGGHGPGGRGRRGRTSTGGAGR